MAIFTQTQICGTNFYLRREKRKNKIWNTFVLNMFAIRTGLHTTATISPMQQKLSDKKTKFRAGFLA